MSVSTFSETLSPRRLPLLLSTLLIAGLAMAVPMVHAISVEDWQAARTFLYCGFLVIAFSIILALAIANRRSRDTAGMQLSSLLLAFVVLPLVLALPVYILVPTITPVIAYFEMLSALTTTGFTTFDPAEGLSPSLHLWKALVAWMGGFLIIFSALAIMAPLNIGGFELQRAIHQGRRVQKASGGETLQIEDRFARVFRTLLPIYAMLTFVLYVLLLVAGQGSYLAFCHALSVVSTSGLSPLNGPISGEGGMWVEVVLATFLVLSATAILYNPTRRREAGGAWRDPELKVLAFFVLALPLALFLRHWAGALEVESEATLEVALMAFWGSVFTVISFLSTAGYESAFWDVSQSWSGLSTPGLILMSLAAVGGGVASTAGGIKLFRIYALYKHGVREMERLVMPSSIAGSGVVARRIRRQGAFIAWIFLMLFLFNIALVMLALTAAGLPFEDALTLSVSALSNTGPGYGLMSEDALRLADLDPAAHLILCAAMIVGRLEALAVIALINPGFWAR